MGAGTHASETACAWRARVDVRVRARASACVDMLAVGCASLGLPLAVDTVCNRTSSRLFWVHVQFHFQMTQHSL